MELGFKITLVLCFCLFLEMGVECGGREVGERDGVAGRFNLVYLTGNFDFFFFLTWKLIREGTSLQKAELLLFSHQVMSDSATPWTVALQEAEWPAAKVKTHRLRIRAQAIQGLSKQFGHP